MTPTGFKNSYMFKRGGALSTLSIFKPKGNNKALKFMSIYYNPNNLRANTSQLGEVDAC